MGTDHILNEVGSRTRRRPMGQDYAAAKDAEVGKLMMEVRGRRSDNRRQIRENRGRVG
jgi:hypothetical protein